MTQKRYVKYTEKDMVDYGNLIVGKEYEIIREQDSKYIIKNECGKEADYFMYRFSEPYTKELEKQYAMCIDDSIISGITAGKEYEIIGKEEASPLFKYYHIKNDNNLVTSVYQRRFSLPYTKPKVDPKDLEISKLKNQIIKLESAMLELKKSKTQEEIEHKYGVQLYPNVVGFHLSVINWYEKTGRLSNKQVDRLKSPMFKIPGISL